MRMEQKHVYQYQKVFLFLLVAKHAACVVLVVIIVQRFVKSLQIHMQLVSLESEQGQELFDRG